mmetsp:Transcript_82981/g.213823  ORF Transcript_82981/g.213823 Transcript_82981/m.213823 type:complete len:518 (-) Transcript_82981:129-1682(-)
MAELVRATLPLLLIAIAASAPGAAAAAEAQATRFRITNGCGSEPIWIAHQAAAGVGPDPQNIRIAPGASYDMTVHENLTGTRYWPKMRCDEHGDRCSIGESGGPGEHCDTAAGCSPPVDTKFEASFGQNGVDWVDISLVDGFTLPFKFEMATQPGKKCSAGDGNRNVANVVDCSALSFDTCPAAEDLGKAGSDVDLRVVNPATGETVGCYSPCSKLTLQQWANHEAAGRTPWDDDVVDYCCPTPPESPKQCREGPVKDTSFVKAVHESCPGVYGYAYDDGMGLLLCPDDTKYEVTFFCPQGDKKVPAAAPHAIMPPAPTPAPTRSPATSPMMQMPALHDDSAIPAGSMKVSAVCDALMSTYGCGWTKDYNCPGQAPGAIGSAIDDGSDAYACCCRLGMWQDDASAQQTASTPHATSSRAPAPAALAAAHSRQAYLAILRRDDATTGTVRREVAQQRWAAASLPATGVAASAVVLAVLSIGLRLRRSATDGSESEHDVPLVGELSTTGFVPDLEVAAM